MITFDELCGNTKAPWGPADYMEFCRRFHTIVLQNIPISKNSLFHNNVQKIMENFDSGIESKERGKEVYHIY
jgi:predicted ATPase